jgi:hypothetical protein
MHGIKYISLRDNIYYMRDTSVMVILQRFCYSGISNIFFLQNSYIGFIILTKKPQLLQWKHDGPCKGMSLQEERLYKVQRNETHGWIPEIIYHAVETGFWMLWKCYVYRYVILWVLHEDLCLMESMLISS